MAGCDSAICKYEWVHLTFDAFCPKDKQCLKESGTAKIVPFEVIKMGIMGCCLVLPVAGFSMVKAYKVFPWFNLRSLV